jgi:hypothetical protein
MHRYVEAMQRKLDMAMYHLEVLVELVPAALPDEHNLPPIPLQAHFEACGRAVVAIPDQLASGLADVTPGMPAVYVASLKSVAQVLEGSLQPSAVQLLGLVRTFDTDARINDLRDVRNRSTHRFDEKEYLHDGGWIVNPPQHLPAGVLPYEGPRRLGEYLEKMIGYGREVLCAVPEIQELAWDIAGVQH